MAEREDRTEAASGRQLQRAREEGNVALSQEVPALVVLAAAALVMAMVVPGITQTLVRRLAVFLQQTDRLDPVVGMRLAGVATVTALAPLVLAALAAAVVAVLAQTGFLVNLSAMMPDLKRLDPRRGLKRVVSVKVLMDSAKSLVKLVVVAWAGWRALALVMPQLGQSVSWSVGFLGAQVSSQILHILLSMLAAQAAIAGLDVLWTRLRHARSLRMSRQDLRDEHKEMEGDPRVKGRLKQMRQQRARRRMMAAVPKATVVVTNPTHYAVALAYDAASRGGAPRVVAKGADEMAGRIREMAQRHRVPIVANPPLTRALFLVPLDAEIPAEHYKMVAEIIAYVWRLRGKAVKVSR